MLRFERTFDGYVTSEGVTLQEIMTRCDRDMEFWGNCVVWIPVYEQKLTQGEILTKYILVYRPLRGAEVVHLPRLFLEERLSIRRSPAVRVEVGELAHTINLAPGEKRTITIERSATSEREERRSAKSLVDVVDASSNDFATEFEREARHETESNRSTSWSVKASGSYGGFSAGAEGSGTSSLRVNDFARRLETIAQKAARSVTRKTQEEINTSTTTKTTTATSEKNVVEVENINAGRSLNLAFYRMNNVSKVGIYLDDLEFVVLPGIETVAGTGIVLPEVYRLSELKLAINRLSVAAMPFRPNGDAAVARRAYGRQLLLDLIIALEDYSMQLPGQMAPFIFRMAQGVAEGLPEIKGDVEAYDPANDPSGEQLSKLIDRLHEFLRDVQVAQTPIGAERELVSGSAGFYLDSFVGLRTGTEP